MLGEPSIFQRAALGAFIGVVVLACLHAGAIGAHQDVGREIAPPRSRATDASSEAARVERAVSPRGRDPRAVSELVAVSGEQQSGSVSAAGRAAVETRDPAPVSIAGDWSSQDPLSQKTRSQKGRVQLAPEPHRPGHKSKAHVRGTQVGPAEQPDGTGREDGTRAAAGDSTSTRAGVTPAPLSTALVRLDSAPPIGVTGDSVLSERTPIGGAALLAARVCWLEAGWRLADCAAITRALMRRAERAGWSFGRMARAYSAIDRQHERAAFARRLPAGLTAPELERWSLLYAIADGALAGRISSPCPRAVGWGGPMDAARPRQRKVRCPGTANWFYRVEPWAPTVIAAAEAAGGAR